MKKVLFSLLLSASFASAEAAKESDKEVAKDTSAATTETTKEAEKQTIFSAEQEKAIAKIVQDQISKNPELLIKTVQQFGEKQQLETIKKLDEAINGAKEELTKEADSIVVGDDKATIKVIAFVDPNCPHCRTFETNINTVRESAKNVKVLYRQYPILGDESDAVARGLIAANKQGKFAQVSDKIAKSKEPISKAKFLEIAKSESGIDLERLTKDMDSDDTKNQIKKTKDLAGKLGIDSTPTMILADKNGARLILGNDVDTLKKEIEKTSA